MLLMLRLFTIFLCAGQKRAPKRGEQQGWNDNRGTEVKQDKAEWRPSFREYRPYEKERQVEFTVEKYVFLRRCKVALNEGFGVLRGFYGVLFS